MGARGRHGRSAFALALSWAALVASGCHSPVRAGLDEEQANQLLVALEGAAIEASKVADGPPGRFAVEVPRDQVVPALRTLQERDLPRVGQPGYEALLDAPGLVSTPTEERARWLVATAGELSRTLSALDGVTAARVHLDPVVPATALDAEAPASSAVALIERRHGHPALDEGLVRSLIAGSTDIPQERVRVLQVEAPEAPAHQAALVRVGPFRVAADDAPRVRLLAGATLGANAILAAGVTVLLWRRRRHPN